MPKRSKLSVVTGVTALMDSVGWSPLAVLASAATVMVGKKVRTTRLPASYSKRVVRLSPEGGEGRTAGLCADASDSLVM